MYTRGYQSGLWSTGLEEMKKRGGGKHRRQAERYDVLGTFAHCYRVTLVLLTSIFFLVEQFHIDAYIMRTIPFHAYGLCFRGFFFLPRKLYRFAYFESSEHPHV